MIQPKLILVTPDDKNRDLHEQLISDDKKDKVHPLLSLNDLKDFRLGYENFSKRCFALVEEGVDGARNILAAIYTHAACGVEAQEPWQKLPGRVDLILNEKSQALEAEPDVVTFYSISSFGKNAGRNLISSLYSVFTQAANPPIMTTLSPIRDFKSWMDAHGFEGSIDDAKEKLLRYLSLKIDKTQIFHQGNGAIVGAVHAAANAPGTLDERDGLGFMVSYRYPRNPEHLEENRYQFKNGDPAPAASHLRPLFGE